MQHGIVVMGIIDEIVYAQFHRHKGNNAGRFDDCIEGRIRRMTAITPTYVHERFRQYALSDTRWSSFDRNFVCRQPRLKYPNLPHIRSATLVSQLHDGALLTGLLKEVATSCWDK